MGGSTVIEGVDDRANMVETQKTFALLGKFLEIAFSVDLKFGLLCFSLKWAKVDYF